MHCEISRVSSVQKNSHRFSNRMQGRKVQKKTRGQTFDNKKSLQVEELDVRWRSPRILETKVLTKKKSKQIKIKYKAKEVPEIRIHASKSSEQEVLLAWGIFWLRVKKISEFQLLDWLKQCNNQLIEYISRLIHNRMRGSMNFYGLFTVILIVELISQLIWN